MKPIVRNIYSDKIMKNITIARMGDFHYENGMQINFLDNYYGHLYSNNPDYIVISGDLVNDCFTNSDKIIDYLHKLNGICPVIVTLGNHDHVTRGTNVKWQVVSDNDNPFIKRLKELRNDANFHLLQNEQESFYHKKLAFVGIDINADYYEKYNEDEDMFKSVFDSEKLPVELTEEKYNIIVCHDPKTIMRKDFFDKIKLLKNSDLILSSHTHNGLVPNFISNNNSGNWGLIAKPGKHIVFFPPLSRGVVNINDKTTGIISGAVTSISPSVNLPIHFLNSTLLKPQEEYVRILKK